jgi:hypothetical protein
MASPPMNAASTVLIENTVTPNARLSRRTQTT